MLYEIQHFPSFKPISGRILVFHTTILPDSWAGGKQSCSTYNINTGASNEPGMSGYEPGVRQVRASYEPDIRQ